MKKTISLLLCFLLVLTGTVSAGAYGFNSNGTAIKKATAYRLPSVNSGDVWWVDQNDKLEVFCKDGDYYLVLYPFNNTGKHVIAYVPTSAVSVTGVPKAADFYENELARTKANATLYHNPSTDTLTGASGSNQTKRATVSKGQEITILFEKDGFYCVSTASDTGFIEKNKICSHANVSRQKTSSGTAANISDATYHEIKSSYKEVCSECGIVIKENMFEIENEKHSFSDSKCSKCGYEKEIIQEADENKTVEDANDCAHTKTYEIGGSKTGEFKGPKDNLYHLCSTYVDIVCSACKKTLQSDVEKVVEEEHLFNGDYCTICAYDKSNKKAEAAAISAGSSSVKVGESVEFTWTRAEYANTYDLHVSKDGTRIDLLSGITSLHYTYQFTSAGSYEIRVYSINNNGDYTAGTAVNVTVKAEATEKTGYVYNTDGDNLNMRSQANTGSSIIAKIPAGATLTVTGDAVNGFYPVKYNGKTGYASASYITFTKPSTSKTAYVYNTDGANLNMRAQASTKSSIVTKMPAGSTLTVTGDATNGFYPVKYGNHSGYASSAYITFTKPAVSSTSNIASQLGKRIANVYNYPKGTSYIGECVWYVRGRASEKLGVNTGIVGHGRQWYAEAKARGIATGWTVKSNSIACFGATNNNSFGHVIFVEEVVGNNVYYTEANVEKPISDGKISSLDGVLKVKSVSSFTSGAYQGCIYLK